MQFETLVQPIFLVYFLFLLLQISAIISTRKLISSLICSFFFLVFTLLLYLIPLKEESSIFLTNLIALFSFILVVIFIVTPKSLNIRELLFPLSLALISGAFISLQSNLFEYPGDISTYLNNFINLSLEPLAENNCFADTLIPNTYNSSCTLVRSLLSIGQINIFDLVNGYPQRLFLGLEITIMSLSYFRLLSPLKLSNISISLSWLILLFGLGNQSILFVLNHGLQGSILAATIFMEIAGFTYQIFSKKDSFYRLFYFISVISSVVLIQLRIHGVFAMSTMLLLTPATLLLGTYCLFINKDIISVSKKNALTFMLSSSLISLLLILVVSGWSVNHVDTRSIVYWSWLEKIGIPSSSQAVSYIFKSPISRPESLAVISFIISLFYLWTYRKGFKLNISNYRNSYILISSIFSISVAISYLIPPFSNLFLNINASDAAATHYRLMWSTEIFSPLPLFINTGIEANESKFKRFLFSFLSLIAAIIVLVPIPNLKNSSKNSQLLWSKTRQIYEGPASQADQSKIVQAILPRIFQDQIVGKKSSFLSDNIINFSLSPYTKYLEPLTYPRRIFTFNELSGEDYNKKLTREEEQIIWLDKFSNKPDWIIQQQIVGSYYSPYSEIGVYDMNIVDLISKEPVNRLSAQALIKSGYYQVKINNPYYKLWKKKD